MGLLDGKTALIFGVSNDHSIGWGITQAFAREGATLGFGYAAPVERWARPLAESLSSTFIEPCDVASDDEIAAAVAHELGHLINDARGSRAAALRGGEGELDVEARADDTALEVLGSSGRPAG